MHLKPSKREREREEERIGVVLSGGQAAGGHNCICALFDFIMQREEVPSGKDFKLFGFKNGPKDFHWRLH